MSPALDMPEGYKLTEVGVIPGDWGIRQIIDVCDFIVPGRNKPQFSNDAIPWITTPDLEDGGKVFESRLGLSVSRAEANSVGSRVVPAGSVVMSCVGELGITAYAGRDIVINQQLHAFIPSKLIDGHFLLHAVRTRKSYLEGIATKTALPYLNKDNCNSIRLPFPPLQEQRAIATALSDVDALLAKLDQLIAKKRDLKQAAMQQLLTGQTRLPGFSGEWVVKRLGDVADIDPENLSSSTSPQYSFKYISLEDVDSGSLKSYSEQVFSTSPSRARRKLQVGDVLVSTVRPNLMSHLLFQENGADWICSTGFAVVRCHKEKANCGFFFAHMFGRLISRQIETLVTGSNYPAINSRDVRAFELPMPSYAEQTAIAIVLSDRDAELAALEARRDKTRALKQGMMQALLTGRIRLI